MDTRLTLASFFFAIVACWFFYAGFSSEVVVDTGDGPIANFQLMQIQSANIAIGVGASVISAIFAIGAAIVGAINAE